MQASYFNDPKGFKGKSAEYYEIVEDVKRRLRRERPNTMRSAEEIVKTLASEHPDLYSLAYGKVQSGKSPLQMYVMWLLIFEKRMNCCFVTKNLSSIRQDIIGKLKTGLIEKHVIDVCMARGLSRDEAEENFFIRPEEYHGAKNQAITTGAGFVPVMIMNKANFEHVLRWYKTKGCETIPAATVFIIDEVHEMYSEAEEILVNNGLTHEDKEKFSGTKMLHWMLHEASVRGKCYVLGVTATPQVTMCSDPICRPSKIYNLKSDAPAKGTVYYGYNDDGILQNINVRVCDYSNMTDSIDQIIARPKANLGGFREVPFLLISTERKNDDQSDIKDELLAAYGNRMSCLVYNQKTNIDLQDWFQSGILTREVCTNGFVAIIAKATLAAGVTVKPSKEVSLELDGCKYKLSGITDQFVKQEKIVVTSEMQMMRLFGWFERNHQSNLWVPDESYVQTYETELFRLTNEFVDRYDYASGIGKLEKIATDDEKIHSICTTSDPYSKTTRRAGNLLITSEDPYKQELETCQIFIENNKELVHHMEADDDLRGLVLESLHKNDACQKKFKTLLDKFVPEAKKTHLQIAYTDKRLERLAKHVFITPDDNHWKVNVIVTGDKGQKTKLVECVITVFIEDCDNRINEADSHDYCFKSGNKWFHISDKPSTSFQHKHMEQFQKVLDSEYSEEHYEVLDDMLTDVKVITGKQSSIYALYMKVCKRVLGTANRDNWTRGRNFKQLIEPEFHYMKSSGNSEAQIIKYIERIIR